MEFLTGRLLSNSLMNIGLDDEFRGALQDLEVELDQIRGIEQDAALGNGGLGRLAACILDSMATLSLPGFGYGIRYEYGIFFQTHRGAARRSSIRTPGCATATRGSCRGRKCSSRCASAAATITFTRRARTAALPLGRYRRRVRDGVRHAGAWLRQRHGQQHAAVVGQGDARLQPAALQSRATTSRPSSRRPTRRTSRRCSTRTTRRPVGRELRLKQQYFFVSASLQDIVQAFVDGQRSLRRPSRTASPSS